MLAEHALRALVVVALLLATSAQSTTPYTFTCSGSGQQTSQVAVMACGCLTERKAFTRAFACHEAAQYETVLANCMTCAKRNDCNCTAPAQGGSSSGSGAADDDDKTEFRETVNNFPWAILFGAGVLAVALLGGCLCLMDKWKKMEEKENDVTKAAREKAKAKKKKKKLKNSSRTVAIVPVGAPPDSSQARLFV